MADSPLNDLNYGRPGLTTYDLDDREWHTSREPTNNILQHVSAWQLAIPASLSSVPTKNPTNATATRKDARRLAHDHPQLGPAGKDLSALSVMSEAVTCAATTYDPHIGGLLSFGTVFLKKSFRPKQIAALPTGPSGNILRLVPLGLQKNGWEGDRSISLQGPFFNLVDSGYWNKEAAPIQQVVFGQTETSNSLLAVRLLSKTVFLRPSYHRDRRAAEPSPHYNLPPSLLSAHSILNITSDQTGGAPHADVAFNPDYQFQFAIVDRQGAWSLWQIERRAKRDEYNVARMVRGHMHPIDDETVDPGDGWARVLWAGDSSTFVVCNRRQLSLVKVNGETFEYLQAPPIIPQRSSDWILDIKQHSQNRLFILTSTRIFLVYVTTSSGAVDSVPSQAGMTVLLSRRHYRGDEDLTLQMHSQSFEGETALFVTSRLNKLVQVYFFQDHPSNQSECFTTTDPSILGTDLPSAANITQIHLRRLEYATKEQPPHKRRNTSAHSYHERAFPFYQLTVLTADLGVYQIVLLSSKHDPNPERMAWRKIMTLRSLDVRDELDELNDFMEPNGPDWEVEPELKLKSQVPRQVSNQSDAHPTADYAWFYEILSRGEQTGSTSIEDVIRHLEKVISKDTPIPKANA
jgi:RNA polymerase I-specific transcription initiation factor RRN6